MRTPRGLVLICVLQVFVLVGTEVDFPLSRTNIICSSFHSIDYKYDTISSKIFFFFFFPRRAS